MPNGGLLQSCVVCKWSQRDESLRYGVRCTRHNMEIHNSHFTFCSDLTLSNEHQEPGRLVTEHGFAGSDAIYIWIEIGFSSKDYPGLPQYHHDVERLCSIAEYRAWSVEQRREAAQAIQESREGEFRAKYGILVQPEWQGRALAWVMKLLHRIFR